MRLGREVQEHKKFFTFKCICTCVCFSLVDVPFYDNALQPFLCPQGNVLSSAASVAPRSLRRGISCVTSSSIQGRNPSSVTCAAMLVDGGMPWLAIYAHTPVSLPAWFLCIEWPLVNPRRALWEFIFISMKSKSWVIFLTSGRTLSAWFLSIFLVCSTITRAQTGGIMAFLNVLIWTR